MSPLGAHAPSRAFAFQLAAAKVKVLGFRALGCLIQKPNQPNKAKDLKLQ